MASLYQKEPPRFFGRAMVVVVGIIFLGFSILTRGQKSKAEFYHVTGSIISLSQSMAGIPNRYEGKMRYLQVNGYPKAFELFIGKDSGDFGLAFEQVEKLKIGDTVTVYFDEQQSNNFDANIVNHWAQFIDKDQKPYFIRGSQDKYVGYSAFGVSACLIAYLLFLKKKGKIV